MSSCWVSSYSCVCACVHIMLSSTVQDNVWCFRFVSTLMCCERRLSKQIKLIFPITHTLNALINATITTKRSTKSRIKIADKNKTEFCFAFLCFVVLLLCALSKCNECRLERWVHSLLIMKPHCCAITADINQLKINNYNSNNNKINNNDVCHGRRYVAAATPEESDQNEGGAKAKRQLKELVARL